MVNTRTWPGTSCSKDTGPHKGAWKLDLQGHRLQETPASAGVVSTSDVLLGTESKTLSSNGVRGGEKQEKMTQTGHKQTLVGGEGQPSASQGLGTVQKETPSEQRWPQAVEGSWGTVLRRRAGCGTQGAYTDLSSKEHGAEVLHQGVMITPTPGEFQEDLLLSIPASGASH